MESRHQNGESGQFIIQSLDRGLELLEFISQSKEAIGLPELAEMLGVNRSTAHRLLGTLISRNFVAQDPVTKKYSVGLKIIELSRQSIDGYSLRTICKPFISELVRETGESANLAVISGKYAVCIDHETSPSPLAVTNNIGVPFVLYATALGKAILAFLPEKKMQALISSIDFQSFTPRTISNSPVLETQIKEIQKKYYSLDDEERYLGVRCIAAPIFDHREKMVAAIGISGPTTRVTLDKLDVLIRNVKNTAFDISVQMGYPPSNAFPGL
jgi:IclR family transcriptional regulator, KDG regulon repressor